MCISDKPRGHVRGDTGSTGIETLFLTSILGLEQVREMIMRELKQATLVRHSGKTGK